MHDFSRPPRSMRTALFWVITQREAVISYGRFGTAYSKQSIHEGPIGCPERSVRNDHCLLRNDPEERSSYRLFQLLPRLLRGRALVASRAEH